MTEQLLTAVSAHPCVTDCCIQELFEVQVEKQPEALAVVHGDQQLTYAELNAKANQLAHYLVAQGITPDQRVAICVDRSLEMVIGLLGVLKAGGAYVPVDPDYPVERIAHILEDAKPQVILTQQNLLARAPFAGLWRSPATPVLVLDAEGLQLPYPTGNIPIQRLGLTPDHLVYVIYTSGSTGKPKGSMIAHRSLVNLWTALQQAIFCRYQRSLRVGLNASFAFDSSLKAIVQLLSGHALVLIPQAVRLEPAALLRYIEKYRLDVLDCTPAQLDRLLAEGLANDGRHHPSTVLVGGEAIKESTWRKLQQIVSIDSYNVYGPTECTVDASICRIKESSGTPNIGRPIANGKIYILDENHRPVPTGELGELYIGGAGVGRGYLNSPGLTGERFLPDPFSETPQARMYKTGDLGRWLPEGSIEFLGRNDFQAKIRGFRVELGEIESQLSHHPKIREAAVTAREGDTGDKRLIAYVVLRNAASEAEDTAITVGEMRDYLAAKLPDYMIPSALITLPSLPLSPHGKIDRSALPMPVMTRRCVAPRTALEQTLAAVWQQTVGVPQAGLDDNFFELGGNSLQMADVQAHLREHLQRDIPIAHLFQYPTIRALAAFLDTTASRPVSRLQRVAARAQRMKGVS